MCLISGNSDFITYSFLFISISSVLRMTENSKVPEAFYWISPSLFPSNYQAAQSWLCISLSVSEQLCSKFYLIITVNSVFKSHWSTNRVIDSQPVDRGNVSLYLKSMPLLSLLASSANHGSFLAKFSPPGLLIIVKDSSWSKACSFHHLTSSLLTKKCCVSDNDRVIQCVWVYSLKCVSFLNLEYVLGINLWWAAGDKITSWKSDAHWDETGHFSKVIIHWLLICDRDYFEREGEKL